MSYSKTVVDEGGLQVVKYTNATGVTVEPKKGKLRNELLKAGLDTEDIIADNANALALIITLSSRMYDVMYEDQKAKMLPQDRQMIEYVFTKYKETNTTADLKFAVQSVGVIDKIFNRWSTIAAVVNKFKKFLAE